MDYMVLFLQTVLCFNFLLTMIYTYDLPTCTRAIQLFPGEIGSGNYTYYRLNIEGTLKIELVSHAGDADLYISSTELRPDFENYELQSVTCGKDELVIGADLKRPVGIGVYGHISNALSTYTLTLYTCGDDVTDYMYGNDHSGSTSDDESPVWSILINILKILLDVLL